MTYKAIVIGTDNDGHGITFYANDRSVIGPWARAQVLAHGSKGAYVEIYAIKEVLIETVGAGPVAPVVVAPI